MALIATCDSGCGATGDPGEFVEFGLVRKVQYCEDCADEMCTLMNTRDVAHSEAALSLERTLLQEVSKFLEAHPTAKLPDGPA